jgi:predicted phosphodiesterase
MRAAACVGTAALAALAAGCLDAAEERATRDEEVGQARAESLAVTVEDGLASVHRLDPEGLELWAGAPRLSLTLSFAATPAPPATFAVTLRNAMPDAVLAAEAGGAALAVSSAGGDIATLRRWSFSPPAAGGEVRLTIAPPDAGAPTAFRFAALADVQQAIDEVQDVYTLVNADPRIRFVVFQGDLTEWGTSDQLLHFASELRSLRVPLYATVGNHELGSGAGAPYRALYGRASYRFLFHGVQFTMLDSASATIAPTTYRHLGSWLDEGRGRVHVVGMHIPPIDPIGIRNGSFASRAEGAKLLALLAGGGVDLTLYGHVHSYYSFWNAGIRAFISGGGGALPEKFDGIGRHFLTIDVDPAAGILAVATVRVD